MGSWAPRNPKELPISEGGEKRRSKGKSGSDRREERRTAGPREEQWSAELVQTGKASEETVSIDPKAT